MIILILHAFLFIFYAVFSEGYDFFDARGNEHIYSKLLEGNYKLKNDAHNEKKLLPDNFILPNGESDTWMNKLKLNSFNTENNDLISDILNYYSRKNHSDIHNTTIKNIDSLLNLINSNEKQQQNDVYLENIIKQLNQIVTSSSNMNDVLENEYRNDNKIHRNDFSVGLHGNRDPKLYRFDRSKLIDYENDFFGNRGRRFVQSLRNKMSTYSNDDFFGHRGKKYLQKLQDFPKNNEKIIPRLESLRDQFTGTYDKTISHNHNDLLNDKEYNILRPYNLERSIIQSNENISPKQEHFIHEDSVKMNEIFGRKLDEFSGMLERRQDEFSATRGRRFNDLSANKDKLISNDENERQVIYELKNNNPNRRIDKSDVFQGSRGRRENEHIYFNNNQRLFRSNERTPQDVKQFQKRAEHLDDIIVKEMGSLGNLGNIFQSRGKKSNLKQLNIPDSGHSIANVHSNYLTGNRKKRDTGNKIRVKRNTSQNLKSKPFVNENPCENLRDQLETENKFNFNDKSGQLCDDFNAHENYLHLDPRVITESNQFRLMNNNMETNEKKINNDRITVIKDISKRNEQPDDFFWAGRGRRDNNNDDYLNYKMKNTNAKLFDYWKKLFDKIGFARTLESIKNKLQRETSEEEKKNVLTQMGKRKIDDTFWAGRGRKKSYQISDLNSKDKETNTEIKFNEKDVQLEPKTDACIFLRGIRDLNDQFWAGRGRREIDLTNDNNYNKQIRDDALLRIILKNCLAMEYTLNKDVLSNNNKIKNYRNKRLTDDSSASDNGKSEPSLFWGNRGRRQEPLYVEEPHWILVRRDKETLNPNQYYPNFDPLFITRGKKNKNLSDKHIVKSSIEYIDY